jgi:GAF domain-containing protein
MTLVLAASAYTERGCAARCWAPAEARRRGPFHPPPGGRLGEAIRTKQTVQVADVAATQAYAERHPAVVDAVELGGVRTNLSVPMLKDNELIGIIAIYRQEVRPFTDKQVVLLTSFANQAVPELKSATVLWDRISDDQWPASW